MDTLRPRPLSRLHHHAWAESFEKDGISYDINADSISVSVRSHRPYYSGDIVIPSTVTHEGKTYSVVCIGDRAFYHCYSLTSVDIPGGAVLQLQYNREHDSLDLMTDKGEANDGLIVSHRFPYDHGASLEANLLSVRENLSGMEQYRAVEMEYGGGMRR